jgi:hypothetical protein
LLSLVTRPLLISSTAAPGMPSWAGFARCRPRQDCRCPQGARVRRGHYLKITKVVQSIRLAAGEVMLP